jgi:hypothetical protein
MLLGAARRFALVVLSLAAATIVGSLAVGLAAGSGLARSISVGFYSVGAVLIAGSFFLGARGPLRPEWGDDANRAALRPRGVRRATPDERAHSVRSSLFLFAVGILLVAVGAAADPLHRNF